MGMTLTITGCNDGIDLKTKRLKMRLITYGKGNAFDIAKFEPIKNRDFVKPFGGLWASPVDSKYGWREWCKDNEFGDLKTHFEFDFEGEVLKINDEYDMMDMPWRRFDSNVVGCSLFLPDFEAMAAAGVDAIWLTEDGERATRFTEPKNLYGWDAETVYTINPSCISF